MPPAGHATQLPNGLRRRKPSTSRPGPVFVDACAILDISASLQRLIQVFAQIVDVFDTDGKAHHFVFHPHLCAGARPDR